MAENRTMRMGLRRSRRAAPTRSGEGFLLVTLAQGVLCVTMIVAAFVLSNVMGMNGLKDAFAVLLSEETQAVEVSAALDRMVSPKRIERLEEMVRELLGRLARRAPTEHVVSSTDSSVLTGSGTLDGVGGELAMGATSAIPPGVMAGAVVLSAPMGRPTSGRLTCGFGVRTHPITGAADFHTGMDIGAPRGTPIFSAYPGTVREVGQSNVYGNFVILDHGNLSTRYGHCETILVRTGMRLRQGERIATVGSTGVSTGPHLHFELRIGERAVDPMAAGTESWKS
ncbi:MAG: M23 family metallopeptidase, partial [Oscillospiraceae bacterium]